MNPSSGVLSKRNWKALNISSDVAEGLTPINRKWSNGDLVNLNLPKKLSLKTWKKNHNSVSINYGPLTFSLKIKDF